MAGIDLSEDRILTFCALRFDGWQYERGNSFAFRRALEQYFTSGRWDLEPNEKLTVFFMLQQGLFRMDLRFESKTSRYWRAFRALFFEVASLEVPQKYGEPHFLAAWKTDFAPNLGEALQMIRQIHEDTEYDECA